MQRLNRLNLSTSINRLIIDYYERFGFLIEQIIWMAPLADGFEKGVRLLGINRTTIPSGSVLVFPFAPSEDIPFQQLIADVTPREWKQIQSGKLPLPEGWDMKAAQVLQRSAQLLRGG